MTPANSYFTNVKTVLCYGLPTLPSPFDGIKGNEAICVTRWEGRDAEVLVGLCIG